MTMYTVKTIPNEADAILKGDKRFIFRENKPQYEVGTNISFAVVDSKRMTPHPIEDKVYRITCIERGEPIQDDVLAIGFREIVTR